MSGAFKKELAGGLIKSNGLKIQTAMKDHYCTLCRRKIPKGNRYWREDVIDPIGHVMSYRKEHTNCEDFKHEPKA